MSKDGPKKVSASEAERALRENLNLLGHSTPSSSRNLIIGLLGILESVRTLQHEHELLHRKLQPILKYLEEENADWRSRYPKYEE